MTTHPNETCAFLEPLVDEWVKVVPRKGRVYVGRLEAVGHDGDEVVLTIIVNSKRWNVRWDTIGRIKLHNADTKDDQ